MKLKRITTRLSIIMKLILYMLFIGLPSLLVLYIKLVLKNSERILHSEPVKKWWENAD
jgi:hypothetical protein